MAKTGQATRHPRGSEAPEGPEGVTGARPREVSSGCADVLPRREQALGLERASAFEAIEKLLQPAAAYLDDGSGLQHHVGDASG